MTRGTNRSLFWRGKRRATSKSGVRRSHKYVAQSQALQVSAALYERVKARAERDRVSMRDVVEAALEGVGA